MFVRKCIGKKVKMKNNMSDCGRNNSWDRLRLRLRKIGWLGRTWGYAPHHPTQVMLEEAELEIDRIGIPATRILHMWQGLEQLGVLSSCEIAAVEGGGRGNTECNDKINKQKDGLCKILSLLKWKHKIKEEV